MSPVVRRVAFGAYGFIIVPIFVVLGNAPCLLSRITAAAATSVPYSCGDAVCHVDGWTLAAGSL